MTAVPGHVLSPDQRFAAIPADDITNALVDEDANERFPMRRSRVGEDTQALAQAAEIRAIYTTPLFWNIAAECPNNYLSWPGRDDWDTYAKEGAPVHFPDYLMLLVVAMAGVAGIGTYRKAAATLADPKTWAELVHHIDQYVPDDWTKLKQLPDRQAIKKQVEQQKRRDRADARKPHLTLAGTKTNRMKEARALRTNHGGDVVHLAVQPDSDPPQSWHLDYWVKRWRGLNYKGQPLDVTDPYYGLRDGLIEKFRDASLTQANKMGLLHPGMKFFYKNPHRHQFVGYDGTVLSVPRKGENPTADLYTTGEGKAYGTKFGITSVRIFGLTHARLLLDFGHIHKTHPASARSEAQVLIEAMRRIVPKTNYGARGVLVDSAIRGKHVIELHREVGAIVVNHPHAEHNPNGGPGRRLAPGRREKSALRHVAIHRDATGSTCEHYIYAVGGEFLQLTQTANGTDTVTPVERLKYTQTPNGCGKRREYLKVKITCEWGDDLVQRIPLFHAEATSTGPAGTNWGETCRAYPPGSAEFKYLYGGRNDTEVRHRDLKVRMKHLPRDVRGQELRLLGASIAMNALAWHAHLQAEHEPNVLDNTA